jgi:hypothetical protein
LGETKIKLEETRANVKNLSIQLNGNFIVILEKEIKSKYIFINLATEKQLAETKITAGNLSTELKGEETEICTITLLHL